MFNSGPFAAVLDAAYHGVLTLVGALAPIAGGSAAALAVVLLTLAVRTALIPVGVSTVRATLARSRLTPQLAELRKRHAKNPQRLQAATLELYRRERVSPFAGILPLLLQAPVLSIVYSLFLHQSIAGHANALLDHALFGAALKTSFIAALGAGDAGALVVGGVLLVLLATAVAVQRKVLQASAPRPVEEPTGATAVAARASSYLAFVTVVFAAFAPLAAGLYLLTTTVWTAAERSVVTALLTRSPQRAATPRGSSATAAHS
ncbi:YidC/Oxa1 family membrane protein insertase [Gryllotalpicola protaetiae]|uniref:Membrane protein insertase YidC n=1 Tax=Gryllotalpicola protaetiae TaxID=2419771 RepID=A0A387BM81_9MICO|nr:membrane protein insertase YidC [Gryllotalpicola protaetiae]AYG02097.1 membrane protein insertase YidC [Gryllotalpicola protaetiae]